MTPLEAAKRLLGDRNEPYIPMPGIRDLDHLEFLVRQTSVTGLVYLYCGGNAPMEDGHMPDCPWLQRGEILAVLEAAEVVFDEWQGLTGDNALDDVMPRLGAAIRGEESDLGMESQKRTPHSFETTA